MSDQQKERLFLSGIIASMFFWGLSWASGKVLSGYGPPENITLFRFFFTFLSLGVVLLILKVPLKISKAGIPELVLASLGISVYTYLFFKGLFHGNAGTGGVLVTTLNPVITYGIMLLAKRRIPERREIFGLLFGLLAGIVLLKAWQDPEKIIHSGNIYFLLATFIWSFISILTSRSGMYGSPVAYSFWMYSICTIAMIFIVPMNVNLAILDKADRLFWANVFFSSTITTAFATTFYFYATSKLGAGKASVFIFIVPFTAALGSYIFIDEPLYFHTIAGGLLGIAAIYMINLKLFKKI